MTSTKMNQLAELEHKLFRLAAEGKLPHALLINSREGGGALPFALKLAKFMLCSNKQQDSLTGCGSCNACQSVDKLIHPDLFLSFPVFNKDSKRKYTSNDFIQDFRKFIIANPYSSATSWIQSLTTDNKQGNISAEECNEITKKLQLKSILGGAKILIIWYAEYLGTDGNRLLKLIEEPPRDTYLFLVCEDNDRILGTIQSRTQQFMLPQLSIEQISEALEAKDIEPTLARQIALQSEGNMHKALQLAMHTDIDYFSHLRDWLNAVYTNNGLLIANWIKDGSNLGKEALKSYFTYAIHIFEQSIRVKFLPEEYWSVTQAEIRLIRGLINKGFDANSCEQACHVCQQAMYHLERNVYQKLVLNNACFDLQNALLKKK